MSHPKSFQQPYFVDAIAFALQLKGVAYLGILLLASGGLWGGQSPFGNSIIP